MGRWSFCASQNLLSASLTRRSRFAKDRKNGSTYAFKKKVSWGWAHTQAGPAIVCFNLVAPVHKANSPHRSGKRQVNARVPLRKGGAVYLPTDSIGCAEF